MSAHRKIKVKANVAGIHLRGRSPTRRGEIIEFKAEEAHDYPYSHLLEIMRAKIQLLDKPTGLMAQAVELVHGDLDELLNDGKEMEEEDKANASAESSDESEDSDDTTEEKPKKFKIKKRRHVEEDD